MFCQNKLEISNSIISTFRGKSVITRENVSLLFPSALAGEAIKIEYPIKALTFLNIFKTAEDGDNNDGIVVLDQQDVIRVKDTMPFLSSEQQGKKEDQEEKTMYCLSIVGRILETKELEKHFLFNRRFLENLVLSSHLDPSAKENEFSRQVEEIEGKLWHILGQTEEFREVRGTSFMADLYRRSELMDILEEE